MVNERTILIADDELNFRDIGREFVEVLFPGYTPETLCDGNQLKSRLEQGVHDVAVIITDNTMHAGPTGSEIIQKYARNPGAPPIILATGDGGCVGEAAVRNGAFGYLKKPYRMVQFEEIVGRALASRQSS